VLWLGACSSGPTGSESAYCTEVGNHLAELNAPSIVTPADITSTVELYRAVRRSAPLAIEVEWQQLVTNVETAATVDAADPASVQRAADTARATQQAANRVSTYTHDLCGVALGNVPVAPVVTLPPTTGG
jgi:hypothetical protein